MDWQSDAQMFENGNQDSFNDVLDDEVSDSAEAFDDPTEGSDYVPVFQPEQDNKVSNGSLPAIKIAELMKLGSLENAPTHSLFGVMKRILDESIERKYDDMPKRVASALRLILQEIEQRVAKHAENMRKLNNLLESREEKYQSKVRVLETLAIGTTDENEVVMNQLQQMKTENAKLEERKKLEELDLIKLRKERDSCQSQILSLNEEMAKAKKEYEENYFKLESKAEQAEDKLQKKILELEFLLSDSKSKVKELEDFSESKFMRWKIRERGYKSFIDSQSGSMQELRSESESIKNEVLKMKDIYAEEFYHFGVNLKGLVDAAQSYHSVLDENRKLYNEVQDLKGNIRVYCRIRPFHRGQSAKQTTIQYIGDNGELVVVNPSKPGKDTSRPFKFNKVFSPAATQEDVFRDTQPLIRSVLDGYNVCIFAYGQTGSGKTYTMTGPSSTSVADWGVNYRALNDLFNISQSRHGSITYEVGVQMVEIYNEQVRDLLSSDTLQKRLGIWNTAQPNGLAVPDASMHPVNSTNDVLELMSIGFTNRAVGATALNERSSRSHSILTVHVRGVDLETNAILRGCLHLVDLAGSERVDRSEVRGDRLREAQHINKSLSALGDVIFALAQKNSHVPYRNSKLTQVLQSSLGGQAKTLMFVQLNPDVESYSETVSTLKFAERVSGVELGAARSNKEGKGITDLMEQVTSLKDAVSKKDEEILRLRSLNHNRNSERRSNSSARYGSASPRRNSVEAARPSHRLPRATSLTKKVGSDLENSSDFSDKNSDSASPQSSDELKRQREFFRQSRLATGGGGENSSDETLSKFDLADGGKNRAEDVELLGLGDIDSEERLSDISDSCLSMGTETDASMNGVIENTLFPENAKSRERITEKPDVPAKLPRPARQGLVGSSRTSLSKSSSKVPSSRRATVSSSSAPRPSRTSGTLLATTATTRAKRAF